MDYKICIIAALVACVAAQFDDDFNNYESYHHKSPVHLHQHQHIDEDNGGHGEEFDTDFHAHPKYSFDYSVKDPHTGDHKEHWETRDGDKVKGTYTVIENDGTKRVVEYEADDKNGFNAVVHRIGTPVKHEAYEPKYEQPKYEQHKYEQPKYEKYEAKPVHEPAHYQHDYGHFDDGFVPVSGGFSH